jgi:hypothetical protein
MNVMTKALRDVAAQEPVDAIRIKPVDKAPARTVQEAEADTVASHQYLISEYRKHTARLRKDGKQREANLAAEKKRVKAMYEADIAELDRRIAEERETGAAEIKAAERIVAASRAALEILAAE